MKELRITAIVGVPDDMFEHADLLAALKPHIEAFENGLRAVTQGEYHIGMTMVGKRAAKGSNPNEYEKGLAERAEARKAGRGVL